MGDQYFTRKLYELPHNTRKLPLMGDDYLILPPLVKVLKGMKGVYLCTLVDYRAGVPDFAMFYFTQRYNLMGLLEDLMSKFQEVEYISRSSKLMVFKIQSVDNYELLRPPQTNLTIGISFEAIKDPGCLFTSFDWVTPLVFLTYDKAYITHYSVMCSYRRIHPAHLDINGDRGGAVIISNIKGKRLCKHCHWYKHPFLSLVTKSYLNLRYVKDLVELGKGDKSDFIVIPKEWRDLRSSSKEVLKQLDIGFLYPTNPKDDDALLEEVLKEIPYFKVLKEPLPFGYVKQVAFEDTLCPLCKPLYKPVWSLSNMKYYSDLCVKTHLLLSNKGLPWDLSIKVTALIVDLKHIDTINKHHYVVV